MGDFAPQTPEVDEKDENVRVGFWRNGFFGDVFLLPPDFFADILSPDFSPQMISGEPKVPPFLGITPFL